MSNFNDKELETIWQKAIVQEGNLDNTWRQDFAGAWIKKDEYGKDSKYGWEVDHLKPVSKGGSNSISNLVPIHWMNNRTKADDYPNFKTSISSKGTENIEESQSWTLKD